MKKIIMLFVVSAVFASCSQNAVIQKTGKVVSIKDMPFVRNAFGFQYGPGDTVVVYYNAQNKSYTYYTGNLSSLPKEKDGAKDLSGSCKYTAIIQ